MIATFKRGVTQGLQVSWTLSKVIFPIALLVTILQHTAFLPWLIEQISPIMRLLGLPGQAAVPLVLGNTLNLYAGIAAIVSFDFTIKEVFIMAIMLSFSHNLFIESTVAIKVGVKWPIVIGVRLVLACLSAVMIHWLWQGGDTQAQYGFIQVDQQIPDGWYEVGLKGILTATSQVSQLVLIVVPLMIIMQYFRELGWMNQLSRLLRPFTSMLGIKPNASMTLVAGLTIGLAYGAGMMIQAVKEDGVTKKDMYLSFIFLVACHAVIEDTLIFAPLGIPVWLLLLIRLCTAILLTLLISQIWSYKESKQRKEYVYNDNKNNII
ncbi:nucleoside recognition domain-containing protein [Amphibacillus sediminis]|uniref:nucleoside recognition domain-containing protein n=1 Tax=Amphibacillus sediminis TaxID=360185 RepID=UPI000833608E|nr:nucleoside recognition domain-containing protein [Amphibacillus sediminis]